MSALAIKSRKSKIWNLKHSDIVQNLELTAFDKQGWLRPASWTQI